MQPIQRSSKLRTLRVGRFVLPCGLFVLAVTAFSAAATWAFDDTKEAAPAEAGIRGIIPDEVPESLSEEKFSALDGAWTEWGTETAAAVEELYNPEVATVADQRGVIASLQRKVDVMERSLADRRYASLHDPLISLHGALSREVDLATAILDTLEVDVKAAQKVRLDQASQRVVVAVDQLKGMLGSIRNGNSWLQYVKAEEIRLSVSQKTGSNESIPVLSSVHSKLSDSSKMENDSQRKFLSRQQFSALEEAIDDYLKVARAAAAPADMTKLRAELATLFAALREYETSNNSASSAAVRKSFNALRNTSPDGAARISQALQTHYFNYNMRVVASEAFVGRLINQEQVDNGPVNDFILGAQVSGSQSTTSKVGVDLLPSNRGVRFNITLYGVVNSNTQGVTDQATIFTQGYHIFNATKQVDFDGKKFATQPAQIAVRTNNNTVGARTTISDLPLFGGIADDYAVGRARDKRPQSEAIAAQRIRSKVLPRFNQEVDQDFADANKKFGPDVEEPLKDLGLFPSAYSYRSTNDEAWISTRLMSLGELGAGAPNTAINSNKGLVVHLHESLLNNSVDRLKLSGRTMSEDELVAEIGKMVSTLLKKDVNLSSDKKDDDPTTFIFPKSDPIRLQLRDGMVTLIIRAGLKQEEGKDDIPTQIITVPLSIKAEGGKVLIERGSVSVAPAERPQSVAKQIVFAGVARNKIESAIKPREADGSFDFSREEKDEKVKLTISKIKSLGGWLSIVLE